MAIDPRWERVQELVAGAEGQPAAERRAWLELTEYDEGLRSEALEMLEAMEAEAAANARATKVVNRRVPEVVAGYRVIAEVGAGGRGVVYHAVREVDGVRQEVALKRLRDVVEGEEELGRFRREQQILASLHHRGIVRFLDAGMDEEGRPYLAMDWVDGETIDLATAGMDRREKVKLMVEALEALQVAHQSLVVHLDVKPSNVLVDRQGHVRLVDFGTAKLLGAGGSATETRQMTPSYASPEQLRGEAASTAADVYGAGMLLYQLLTGKGVSGVSIVALAERATRDVMDVRVEGDGDLEAIVRKATRFEPEARYRSAGEFADDLEAWLAGRVVRAQRSTWWYRVRRFVGRNRVAVAAGVVLVGLVGYGVMEQQARVREAEKGRMIADFLRGMIVSSATAASGNAEMSVLEMVERAVGRLDALPADVAAGLESDFAYFEREAGREKRARELAEQAVGRADKSGDAEAMAVARQALGEIALRMGDCKVARESFVGGARGLRPGIAAAYLIAAAGVKSRCEGKAEEAIGMLREAQRVAVGARDGQLRAVVLRAAVENALALELIRQERLAEAKAAITAGLALAAQHADGRNMMVALLRMRGQMEARAGDADAAWRTFTQAADQAEGVATVFERLRLQLMAAGQEADLKRVERARYTVNLAIEEMERRAEAMGPTRWMLLADAAEVMARAGECEESRKYYARMDALTGGEMPRDWRGNRLFYGARCAEGEERKRLAREARESYGGLLRKGSTREKRITEMEEGK